MPQPRHHDGLSPFPTRSTSSRDSGTPLVPLQQGTSYDIHHLYCPPYSSCLPCCTSRLVSSHLTPSTMTFSVAITRSHHFLAWETKPPHGRESRSTSPFLRAGDFVRYVFASGEARLRAVGHGAWSRPTASVSPLLLTTRSNGARQTLCAQAHILAEYLSGCSQSCSSIEWACLQVRAV